MDYEKCYGCRRMVRESRMKPCGICKYNSYCIDCVPDIIDFKVIKLCVCEECVCNPDDSHISELIDSVIKDLDIVKSDFLKIMKVEKTIKYDFAYFINKLNAQINRLNNKILKKEDIINESKTKLKDAVKNLRLIEKLRLLSN